MINNKDINIRMIIHVAKRLGDLRDKVVFVLTTLKRHLATSHNLKPGQYRKQFNVPKDQPLAATEYVAKRRQMALDRGLGDKLATAREAKKAKE